MLALFGVKEDAPLFQRSAEDFRQLLRAFHDVEAALRILIQEGLIEIAPVDLGLRFRRLLHLREDLIDGVSGG